MDPKEPEPEVSATPLPAPDVGVDVFEMVGLMFVASGDMSETRMRRAVEKVREAVSR